MRTQLEVDPFVGLRSLDGILPLIEEYKWAIDIEICVFPEEGLFNQPDTDELMIEALKRGCKVIGANPSIDSDPTGQIDWVFETAREFDVDIDMHVDADENPDGMLSGYVCELTEKFGYGGRVTLACQRRRKKGPPRRCKKGPLGGCGLVPVVHGRAPRATRRALNRLTRRRAREGPVGPRGQAWAGWSVQLAVGV